MYLMLTTSSLVRIKKWHPFKVSVMLPCPLTTGSFNHATSLRGQLPCAPNSTLFSVVMQLRILEKTSGLAFSLLSSSESSFLFLVQGQGVKMGWCSNTLSLVHATALAGQCLLYRPHSSRLSLAPVLPEICSVLCSQDGPHIIPNQDAFTDWPWCFLIRSLMFQQHMAESILSLFWGWKFTVLQPFTSVQHKVQGS